MPTAASNHNIPENGLTGRFRSPLDLRISTYMPGIEATLQPLVVDGAACWHARRDWFTGMFLAIWAPQAVTLVWT